MKKMKGVIRAGGFGKRLGELTKDFLKPLLPICSKPIINYIVEK
jgi:NDP-sugar pyrophosphorylase family protein